MDVWDGYDGMDCPEAEECEEMLAKLSDIRFYLARRAAEERTRTYQRAQKRLQRQRRPTPFDGRKDATPESPSPAA